MTELLIGLIVGFAFGATTAMFSELRRPPPRTRRDPSTISGLNRMK